MAKSDDPQTTPEQPKAPKRTATTFGQLAIGQRFIHAGVAPYFKETETTASDAWNRAHIYAFTSETAVEVNAQ